MMMTTCSFSVISSCSTFITKGSHLNKNRMLLSTTIAPSPTSSSYQHRDVHVGDDDHGQQSVPIEMHSGAFFLQHPNHHPHRASLKDDRSHLERPSKRTHSSSVLGKMTRRSNGCPSYRCMTIMNVILLLFVLQGLFGLFSCKSLVILKIVLMRFIIECISSFYLALHHWR